MKISDSVLAAYVSTAVRMHGSAGKDIGDEVTAPDEGVVIGKCDRGTIWRLKDGWGAYYFLELP